MPHPTDVFPLQRSREGYSDLARAFPARFNATSPMDALHEMALRDHSRGGEPCIGGRCVLPPEHLGGCVNADEAKRISPRSGLAAPDRCNKAFANGRRCHRVKGHAGMHCAASGYCNDAPNHNDLCHCETYAPELRDGAVVNPRCACGGFP